MSASTPGPLKKTTARLPPAHPFGNAGALFTATIVTPPAGGDARAAQHALTRAHDSTRADPFSAPTKHRVVASGESIVALRSVAETNELSPIPPSPELPELEAVLC